MTHQELCALIQEVLAEFGYPETTVEDDEGPIGFQQSSSILADYCEFEEIRVHTPTEGQQWILYDGQGDTETQIPDTATAESCRATLTLWVNDILAHNFMGVDDR